MKWVCWQEVILLGQGTLFRNVVFHSVHWFLPLKIVTEKQFLHSKNDIFISCNKLNSLRTFYLHNCQDVLSFLFLLTFFSFSALNAVIILNSWSSNCNLFEWCFHVFKPHLKIFQPYCFLHYHSEVLFHSVNKRKNAYIHLDLSWRF